MVMILRINAPDWEKAKCRSFPGTREYDPWFDDEDEVLPICNGDYDGIVCPKRHDCLIFALTNNEHYGVWGGMLVHDRNKLRRFTPKKDWKWHPPTPRDDEQPSEPAGLSLVV